MGNVVILFDAIGARIAFGGGLMPGNRHYRPGARQVIDRRTGQPIGIIAVFRVNRRARANSKRYVGDPRLWYVEGDAAVFALLDEALDRRARKRRDALRDAEWDAVGAAGGRG